jgi:CelD/BcsL family acetyltransferase involved in cellulose biosynthesis
MLQQHSDFDAVPPRLSRFFRRNRIDLHAATGDGPAADAWDRLEASADWPTQTRLFAATLHRLFPDRLNIVLAARDGGALGGILPLSRDRGWLARWHIVGAKETHEPGDALCASPMDARRIARAAARLRRPLMLHRVSARSPLAPALRAAIRGRGWFVVRPAMPCPFITLNEGWRDPEARFNAGRRSDFRRAQRRAETHGVVTFETIAPDARNFDDLFDEAVRVEAAGWKAQAGTALAKDVRQEAIFRAFFRAAMAQDAVRISFMRIDGRAMAMQMALLWQGRYWLFKIGHDEAFNACSPGNLLMLHALGWAARQGLSTFEFLGVAEPWITSLWTREQHDCVQLRTYPYGLRGGIALASDSLTWLLQRLRR